MAQLWTRTLITKCAGGPKYFRQLLSSSLSPISFKSSSSSSLTLPRLTLYTHDDCSLCDDALEAISHLNARFYLETVDILHPDHKEWRRKYRYDIPVFHFQGEFLMKHRADVKLLETKLKQFESVNCTEGEMVGSREA